MRRLQQSDDQKNIYDKILENVNTFLAPVIIKGDYILVLFDLSTKYLNIIDLSFVNKLFVLFKQKIQSFIEDHNILIRSKIREGIDLAFSITEPLFILIINYHGPLLLLLPPPGTNKLIDQIDIITFEFRQPLFFYGINLGFLRLGVFLDLVLSFEIYLNAEWGWLKTIDQLTEKQGELFIQLLPTAKITAAFDANVDLIFVRFGVVLVSDLIRAVVPVKISLDYQISLKRFYCRALLTVNLNMSVLNLYYQVYYQFLEIRWIWIRIRIWFIKIWIPIIWFVWGPRHGHITSLASIPVYTKSFVNRELFKEDIYYIDKVERYLIDALGV